jgi:hypothetical protein
MSWQITWGYGCSEKPGVDLPLQDGTPATARAGRVLNEAKTIFMSTRILTVHWHHYEKTHIDKYIERFGIEIKAG